MFQYNNNFTKLVKYCVPPLTWNLGSRMPTTNSYEYVKPLVQYQ